MFAFQAKWTRPQDMEAATPEEQPPRINLTIVPLGAVLIFICVFCYKTFHWIVDDLRERDAKEEKVRTQTYCQEW